jgi:phage terminase large subunit-like protein
VVGVDPPASARGDECGIVVCGIDEAGTGHLLADCSLARPSPESWARRVAQAARPWGADRVIAEANQGGAMVKSVLHAADCALPVRLVHASRGKVARAEPVAALYEAGRVRHAGMFGRLEDQLCGLMAGGEYQGPGRSPDRADALVWALTELMLGRRRAPRVQLV